MTTLIDTTGVGPGTHALVVGVGDYPHLRGGRAPAAQQFAFHMNMGQLTSPEHSVLGFGDWLIDTENGMNNPNRPLLSLEVLCSSTSPMVLSAPDAEEGMLVEAATKANFDAAVARWIARANAHPDNLLLFYFCGHGLTFSHGNSSLLMSDFGRNDLSPMADAIDFTSLRFGLLSRCRAKNQLYFVDACRTRPTNAFLDQFGEDDIGDCVVAGGLRRLSDKNIPAFYATSLGAAAYGQTNQASVFTQGLLKAFQGSASREVNSGWEVLTTSLAEGVNKCVEALTFQKVDQYCQGADADTPLSLHRLRDEPEVVVKVVMGDSALMEEVLFSCESLPAPPTFSERREPPIKTPWWLHLRKGQYAFAAASVTDQSIINQRSREVAPPGAEVVL
jgi:hypothetical protein